VVVQQPVGLLGAQVVRMGQDVLVAADAPQPADELCDGIGVDRPLSPAGGVSTVVVNLGHPRDSLRHHPRQRSGLQQDEHGHDQHEQEAPADDLAEDVALVAG
jgi:hypothetical protein